MIDRYIESAIRPIPVIGPLYMKNVTTKKFVNYGALYFITYWVTAPLTVAFALGLGGTPLAWILAGFFLGAIVAIIRFVGSNWWIWKPSGEEQLVHETPAPIVQRPAQVIARQSGRFKQRDSPPTSAPSAPVPTASPNIELECPRCKGTKYVLRGEQAYFCGLCHGTGKISPKHQSQGFAIPGLGSIPGLGGQKIPKQFLMLIYIAIGILMIAIGTKLPGIFQTMFVLGGVGIVLIGVWMFKSKPVTKTTPTVTPKG